MISRILSTLIRWVIRFYQIILRPVLKFSAGPAAGCRYWPSCSNYFLQAVQLHGPFRGSWYRHLPDFPLSSMGWQWL